jgi:hypothetical protein
MVGRKEGGKNIKGLDYLGFERESYPASPMQRWL